MKATEINEASTPEHLLDTIVRVAIVSPERLRRFLRRWEKDDSHVDDIIGASLLNALKCIHNFTGVSNVEVWFYGVCKNTARQHVATRVRNNRDFFEVEDFELIEQQIIDSKALTIEDGLIKKQHIEKIAELLSILPDDQQDIFQAIYIDGLSYTEVSQQFDIPLGTVKSRVNRVRVNLIEKISYLTLN